ncbi:ATP synthase subunit I [Caballeronia sp. AZ1_KS37]|uniref:N-ATPase subunit AtpR n=1 Tax=Caballeronia sp. AZ1_KS37 TaxID=2921756 RepID=UPI0020292377|nr:ATP synthase subunit I [Caballeronia sp. AZ1_KS37]
MILNLPLAARVVMGPLAGFALGLAHFGTLAANVRLITHNALWRALALQILRVATTVLVFMAIARLGPLGLLGAAAGFLVARTATLVRAEKPS